MFSRIFASFLGVTLSLNAASFSHLKYLLNVEPELILHIVAYKSTGNALGSYAFSSLESFGNKDGCLLILSAFFRYDSNISGHIQYIVTG